MPPSRLTPYELTSLHSLEIIPPYLFSKASRIRALALAGGAKPTEYSDGRPPPIVTIPVTFGATSEILQVTGVAGFAPIAQFFGPLATPPVLEKSEYGVMP